jgi:hypothetical protein
MSGFGGKVKLASALAGLYLALVPQRAAAQPAEFGPYYRPAHAGSDWGDGKGAYARVPATGDYVHDGLYLRLAGGLGGATDRLTGSGRSSEGPIGRLRGSVSSIAGATQVAVGFTPLRGWVLGVAIDTVTLSGGQASLKEELGQFEFGTSQLAVYGVLIDYYHDALRGFHVQATGGITSYVMSQGQALSDGVIAPPHAAVGGGFSLGLGNQWWISPEWSVGVLPRLMLGWASGTDQFGAVHRHRGIGYSLLLTMTYH